MALTAPPTIPLITDPSTFSTRAQDWVMWQAEQLYPELVNASSALGLSLSGTSVTSNLIGTGSKSFTVQTGKGFAAGQSIVIARTSAPTNRMFGLVTSYNSGTGALVFESQAVEGTGTFTDWTISPTLNAVITAAQIPAGLITNDKLDAQYIDDLTAVTLDPATDYFPIADGSDTGNKKKVLLPNASQTAKGISELATSAEIKGGTDGERTITSSELLAALGFSGTFLSSAQTITSGGLLTIAHGLGRKPVLMQAFVKNTTAEGNWSIGDEVFVSITPESSSVADSSCLAIYADTTNVYVRMGSTAQVFSMFNKTTGAGFAFTNANWQLYVRAWG